MRVSIKDAARTDLREIAAYIARDNPDRAESFIDELLMKIQTVATRPLSFPARNDWGEGLRSAVHGRYLIVFRVNGELLEVLRVLHGSRDIDGLVED